MDEVRIVVVDDYADAADALAVSLQLDGYSVRIAADGESALTIIAAFEPHAVLLDINMPRMNGAVLAKTLRERYGDDIVLIAVTGYGRDEPGVAEAFDCVDHYLQKPVGAAQLRKALGTRANL
ncbi:MAG: response regulator [Caldimonas sp.]